MGLGRDYVPGLRKSGIHSPTLQLDYLWVYSSGYARVVLGALIKLHFFSAEEYQENARDVRRGFAFLCIFLRV